jgi:hypothetical protein
VTAPIPERAEVVKLQQAARLASTISSPDVDVVVALQKGTAVVYAEARDAYRRLRVAGGFDWPEVPS